MATDTIRVFLVDHEAGFRDDLRRGLEQAGVAVAGDAGDAVSAARELPDKPVDVVMVDDDGDDQIGQVLRAAAGSAVVALSDNGEPEQIVRMLAAGAHGYLVKDEGVEEVAAAVVRAAAHGENLVSPRIAKLVMARLRELEGAGPPAPLTERELDVLRLLAERYEPGAIAAQLGLGIGSVRDDIVSIRAKLGVGPARRFARAA